MPYVLLNGRSPPLSCSRLPRNCLLRTSIFRSRILYSSSMPPFIVTSFTLVPSSLVGVDNVRALVKCHTTGPKAPNISVIIEFADHLSLRLQFCIGTRKVRS